MRQSDYSSYDWVQLNTLTSRVTLLHNESYKACQQGRKWLSIGLIGFSSVEAHLPTKPSYVMYSVPHNCP